MANTENIEAKLCAYVDGELDPAGRAEIEVHLASNPGHRQLMEELIRQREMLRDLPRARAPEDLFEAMQNQLERSVLLDAGGAAERAAVAGRINPWPQRLAAAAVVLLAVGLAAVIYFVLPQNSRPVQFVLTPPASGPAAGAVADTDTPGDFGRGGSTQPSGALAMDNSADTRLKTNASSAGDDAKSKRPDSETDRIVSGAGSTATGGTSGDLAHGDRVFGKGGPIDALKPPAGAGGAGGGGSVGISNIFANAVQLSDELKKAPGVPDKAELVVVASDNPTATHRQVQEYFANNGITWTAVPEPMPQPLDLQQGQILSPARMQQTRMHLKGGGEPAAPEQPQVQTAPADGAVGGLAGGNKEMARKDLAANDLSKQNAIALNDPAAGPRVGTPVTTAPADQQQRSESPQFTEQQQVASAARPSQPGAAGQAPASAGAGPSGADAAQATPAQPATPAPPAAAAPSAAPSAVAVAPAPTDPPAAEPGGGADPTTPPIGQPQAAPADITTASPGQNLAVRARREAYPMPGSQSGTASAAQQQAAAPPPPPAPVDPATELRVQAEQQVRQSMQQQQAPPAADAAPPAVQVQPTLAAKSQYIVARGLTRRQVSELNSTIATQNSGRVSNYTRAAGGAVRPTTLPADLAAQFTLQPQANAPKYGGHAYEDKLATESGAGGSTAHGGQAASAPTTLPAAVSSDATKPADAAGGVSANAPTTAPAASGSARAATAPSAEVATTTMPFEERVDVVIVVQADAAAAPPPDAAPNAAPAPMINAGPAEAAAPATAPAAAPATSATAPANPAPLTPPPPAPATLPAQQQQQ